jgi:hypothetical protein
MGVEAPRQIVDDVLDDAGSAGLTRPRASPGSQRRSAVPGSVMS